jgi:hypothetical protein
MKPLETKIKSGLAERGIRCQSVYIMPNLDTLNVLLGFKSHDNQKLTIPKIERVLNSLGMGEFKVPREFQRLSASFLHLEVSMGSRTERVVSPDAC